MEVSICLLCKHLRQAPDSYDCYNCHTDSNNVKPSRFYYDRDNLIERSMNYGTESVETQEDD